MAKNISVSAKLKIEQKILFIRGQKVMLDKDLAELYGVPTKALNQAVKRNIERFPNDFMFRLTKSEMENWRSQFVTSNFGRMGLRRMPYAFTENGVAMLSSVLQSSTAVQVNIQIMRIFTQLRQALQSHKNLWQKINTMENKYDDQFKAIFDAIRRLIAIEESPKRRIGFHDADMPRGKLFPVKDFLPPPSQLVLPNKRKRR